MSDHLAKTPAFRDFERNLEYAKQLINAGRSLDAIGATSFDLGDLYRAAWVQSVAALDHWIRQEIFFRAILLTKNPDIAKPPKFREFAVPMELFEDVQHHRVPLDEALGKHLRQVISRRTFQGPDDIKDGLAIVSTVVLWEAVAKIINKEQEPAEKVDSGTIKQMLRAIVHRRNKITHEADRVPDDDSLKRSITADEAQQAVETLERLATAILIALNESPEGKIATAVEAIGPAPALGEGLSDEEFEDASEEELLRPPTLGTSGTPSNRHYRIEVRDLIEAGLVKPGAELRGSRRREQFTATIEEDGRIRLASGRLYPSLSKAGGVVLQGQSCNGWAFWKIETDDGWGPIGMIRDQLD
ncbi:hypothetical protein SAMN05216276_1001313 [Streptosporangium subroseum]|uniref:RAMA domain-containing protein n=1 Tax=Streptosporangium subroseum TaxID=106412 RepID=A0A239AER3_9ACTN|nr:hypothetical protein [Streptosporangium subroseum]SNR93518.1 hypothetical protein SAMN05216276_1001313 [Streptosporangium subroseum]